MTTDPNDDQGKFERREVGLMANAWTLAILFPASIVAGFLLGRWLDTLFHTDPWLAVAGTLLGMVGAFLNLIQFAKTKG